jgi:hypothetical protein
MRRTRPEVGEIELDLGRYELRRQGRRVEAIRSFYDADGAEVLADSKKQAVLFYRIFPNQVDGLAQADDS